MNSWLLGYRIKEKWAGPRKLKYLKNLEKPRTTAFTLYSSHLNKTFLLRELRGAMACYATFLSLKNDFLYSKIEPLLNCCQKF